MPGYADLPDEVLRRVLSGMLLTFYRSVHKGRERRRALFVVEGIPISHGSYETNADVGIIDRSSGKVVALYQVLTPGQGLADFQAQLEILQAYIETHAGPDYPVELGVAVPESFGQEAVLRKIGGENLRIMTYPG